MIRRLWLRMRTPCVTWPCKRCDKAGRTFWTARKEWHHARRLVARRVVVAVVVLSATFWTVVVAIWAVTR